MIDIFLSYASADRDRVRPLHDALSRRGFDVFWDQKVPVAADWDTWIRGRLRDARVALVVWSRQSVMSDNVRQEALIAREQGKLVAVLLDPLSTQELPLGLGMMQAGNLSTWTGGEDDEAFLTLSRSLQAKLTPSWLAGELDAKDHVVADERARRSALEGQVRALRDQITREGSERTQLQDEIRRLGAGLDDARAELASDAKLRAENDEFRSAVTEAAARIAALEDELKSGPSAERSTFASRWLGRILVPTALAFLAGLLALYLAAAGAREQAEAERDSHAARATGLEEQLRDLQVRLDGTLAENQDLRQQLTHARSAAQSQAASASATPGPPPELCPEADSDKFWTGPSTFAVNKGFSRSCVEKVAQILAGSQSTVGRLVKPGQGAAGTAQFVAYVLSINGIHVNPNACNAQCFTKQLRTTDNPQAGDVVLFPNDTLGLYASDSKAFVLKTGKGEDPVGIPYQYSYVDHEVLPRAQVKAFLSVTAK